MYKYFNSMSYRGTHSIELDRLILRPAFTPNSLSIDSWRPWYEKLKVGKSQSQVKEGACSVGSVAPTLSEFAGTRH